MNYLDTVLKSTGKQEPSQLILYFFDTSNLIFLKNKIESSVKHKIDDYDVFGIMLDEYKKELLHNQVSDILKTVKKLNGIVIKSGILETNSSKIIQTYRDNIHKTRVCDLPICVTNKQVRF